MLIYKDLVIWYMTWSFLVFSVSFYKSWTYGAVFISNVLRMARGNEESLSFTFHPHVDPRMKWAILPLLPSRRRRRASPHFGRYSFPVPLRVGGWVGLGGWLHFEVYSRQKTVTHPSTIRDRVRVTSSIRPTPLTLRQTTKHPNWELYLWGRVHGGCAIQFSLLEPVLRSFQRQLKAHLFQHEWQLYRLGVYHRPAPS